MNKNHLIAEFMGLTYEERILIAPHGSQDEIKYNVYFNGNREVYLKYDTSWDALMPVVNAINDLCDDEENFGYENVSKAIDLANDIYETFIDPSIETTYDEVFKFVEFYTKIKK